MTTSKPTEGTLDAKLERMLANWEKPAVRSVMLPGTQMTCDEAAAAIRAALTGTVEPAKAMAVKALEWKLRSSAFSDEWKANTVVGRYDVGIVTHGFMAIRRSVEDGQDEDTILAENVAEDEAKAAAQADYEARIRSALAPAALSNPEAPAAPIELGLTDEMVVAAMEHVPGCDHDDMVSALEAALAVCRSQS
ncbi:hypothetical protein NKI48_03175 [Mesorhizobium sp. M0644]|uniref:hypothetical protein n=1 Tax=Mesorhizobium sp. M0644 TaxID=2956979 RepID=UPI003338CFC0